VVTYREIDAKSLTRLSGIVDPWFLARYGMNLYRGCEHGCTYCDGRAERYYVQGDFARDIVVKRNAVTVLDAELARAREPGFVFIGGGVCDGYQPAEERFGLARGALELARKYGLAVHVLTKSSLVERDLKLLASINAESRAILSMSIQTLDETVRERFEPLASPITARLEVLARAKAMGINTAVMAMPVLPGISDQPPEVDDLVAKLAEVGVDFVSFGGLTLRPGVQRETYLQTVAEHYPTLLDGYARAYRSGHRSGAPDRRYLKRVDDRFHTALQRHGLPARPPRRLFQGMMPLYAELAVLLEHHDAQARIAGCSTPSLGRSGFAIQQWARKSFAKRGRRKAFSYQLLQEEISNMIADGSVTELAGFDLRALEQLRKLTKDAKRSEWIAWRHRTAQ